MEYQRFERRKRRAKIRVGFNAFHPCPKANAPAETCVTQHPSSPRVRPLRRPSLYQPAQRTASKHKQFGLSGQRWQHAQACMPTQAPQLACPPARAQPSLHEAFLAAPQHRMCRAAICCQRCQRPPCRGESWAMTHGTTASQGQGFPTPCRPHFQPLPNRAVALALAAPSPV